MTPIKVIGAILGVLAFFAAIWALAFGIGWVTADPNGKLDARKQLKSGAYRIAAYDHFFDLCQAVQTDEASLDAQMDELKTATGEDVSRINANIAALKAARLGSIFEYNADASKSYTLGQFRSSHLPYRLSTEPYTGGKTVCTV